MQVTRRPWPRAACPVPRSTAHSNHELCYAAAQQTRRRRRRGPSLWQPPAAHGGLVAAAIVVSHVWSVPMTGLASARHQSRTATAIEPRFGGLLAAQLSSTCSLKVSQRVDQDVAQRQVFLLHPTDTARMTE